MSSPPDSTGYAKYWRDLAAQAEYRAALDVLNGSPAPASQPAPQAAVGASRAELLEQIAEHEGGMRAEVNSVRWNAYLREGGDKQYAAALERLNAPEPAAPPAIPTIAGGVAAPATPAGTE
jgi:hypothetical protein